MRSSDPVAALLDFARSHGVGHIIIGRSNQAKWRQRLGMTADARLLREGEGFDIHVVSFESHEEKRP
ncbi:adenine nucleotide alpha hydrolase family protein [Corallococcus exiguus]|uniref:hypothetical protein n=1 Tax=Corallococcus exiguus TaxID=83462 RepID=UPI001F5E7EDD|nr:hypothetical protein [Corallococcus exiguus]